MIKKLPFLLVIVSLLISCEAEEFDTTNFQSTGDTDTIDENIEGTDGTGGSDTLDPTGDDLSTCVAPKELTIAAITNETANLTWSLEEAELGEYSWEVRYSKKVSLNEETATILSADINNIMIDDLEPSTVYEVFVRTNCGAGNYSDWSNAIEITTL
ncbi:fibronectin type III domain-containing protein [Aquimarina sp. 2201CG14-23]|uniref:fibronectin type III domain-containing protein n=1 Tax=Aquimarina mycalae TaxID=3040073 RepID=UPI002477DFA7|nr:fibronectin type III domain-containing protein [Aquimarina sp. 2201CG14-23]MDH7444393.1 fibronectin type III domain-containing protein [Aquimarina sp. 2201CG14-23]